MLLEQKQWKSILIKIKMIEVNIFFSPRIVGHCVSSNSNVVASCESLFANTTNVWTGAEAAEEKFKEVVKSYEAIKLERKNG